MSSRNLLLIAGLVLILFGRMLPEAAAAEPKDKIVGSWTYEKATSSDGQPVRVEKSVTLEFTADGKVNLTVKGLARVINGGTYVVTGDELRWTGADKNVVVSKIKSITDKDMITEDKKGDATVTTEFKRK